jgi:succinate dehydrogenase / fumarate reductase flavoprotein subunit
VLVIGAGGAGLRAALSAAGSGSRVAVVSKSLLGKSQTVMGAALAAVLGGGEAAKAGPDTWQAHYADTVRGARHVNQWRMAQLLAQEAPARVRELEAWGMLFDRAADGGVRLAEGSGHRHARLARLGHRTGLELLRVMQNRLAAQGVDLYAECTIVELLKSDGRIAGAFGYRRESGEALLFSAPAVVLATGGIGKAYAFTSNFYDSTGDGHALACRAGADLVDMEFVQFHPTGMVAPESARGLLVAESIRNFGGVLLNASGERFMFRYVPEGYRGEIAETESEAEGWYTNPRNVRRPPELLPRDEVSRAMESEVRAGRGTPNGGVILDIASRRPADFIRKALPHMYRQFLDLADVDIGTQAMEVAPTCHFMMGGVRVEADTCAASVPGLFAAGETAGGLHGANRLNGNGISELIVFGHRAGQAAMQFAAGHPVDAEGTRAQAAIADRDARRALAREAGENPHLLLREVQHLMQGAAALVRTREGLSGALKGIASIAERADRAAAPGGPAANPAWQAALDLRSILTVAEAVVRSALERRETRGAHVREDFPRPDAELARRNVIVRGNAGALETALMPCAEPPEDLRALALEGAEA